MKEFISKVVLRQSYYTTISLNYTELQKVQNIVLNSLDLDNMNDLRDKFEGLSYNDKFSLKVFGVIALEKLFKYDLLDLSTINPKTYLPQINILNKKINVFMSEFGEFPIIDKLNILPAIITIKKDEKNVWICGYADVQTLNNFQNESFLKGSMLKYMNLKTTFVGFEHLKFFKSLDDLKKII